MDQSAVLTEEQRHPVFQEGHEEYLRGPEAACRASGCADIKPDDEAGLKNRTVYLRLKRAQDVILSLLALIVLSPLMLITALAIVIDDPKAGPIFRQTRIGRNGKPFTIYKFRSMCADAEERLPELLKRNEMEGPAFKLHDDPRITRIGRIIRKTSIDELPQLINILKGDMTIVGPRPALPREVLQYSDYQRQRLEVVPGLTCYWQVQPHRNDIPFDEWVELDLKYIRERSIKTDWKIIIKTFGAVISCQGV